MCIRDSLIHHTVDVVTKTTVEICIYLKLCADMLGCDRPVKTTVLIDSILNKLASSVWLLLGIDRVHTTQPNSNMYISATVHSPTVNVVRL